MRHFGGRKKLKVILVNPPGFTRYPQPPLGLAIIAAVLEGKGYQVNVLDANVISLRREDIVSQVANADILGLTAVTPTINAAINIARQVKHANPDLFIILGGAHATLLPEDTLASAPEIDAIVAGEGEKTVVDLLWALEHGQPLDNIPNITYRDGGKVVSHPAVPTEVDLDSLPYLAYHLLPWQKYKPHPPHGRVLPFAAIITSRGCPYQCAYCSKPVFGSRFRAQSPGRTIEEIAYYKDKFGIKELAFYDDVFTLNKKRVHAIADGIIEKGLRIQWTCETRVNLVDRELLRHMKQAGCYAIAYGIESGSQEILDALCKDITLQQAEEAVQMTREVGLQSVGYFMLGSPGESSETIRKTIWFAKKLKLDFAQFAITTPFPGTKLYELYSKERKGDVSWESLVYEPIGTKTTPVFESNVLRQGELQTWVKRAYREFYLRPSYIWQRIRRLASIGDLKLSVRGLYILLQRAVSR